MIADFVIVETNDFQSLITHESPSEGRPSASWKGISEINIVELWALLLNEEYSEQRRQSLKMLFSEDGGTIWLMVFPDELVGLLTSLDSEKRNAIGSQWAKSEEFQWGWSETDVQTLLNDIVDLAHVSKDKSQALILWGSL